MFERVSRMLIKEFIQIFRDPRMKGVIFFMPLVQSFVFGYAVTTDVTHIPTAIFDLDNSRVSRELVSRFVNSRYFEIAEHVSREERAKALVDRGEVKAVLRINKGFGEALRKGQVALLQVIVDGTDSNTAGIILDYVGHITAPFSEQVLMTRILKITGQKLKPGRVELETRAWFNENLESRNYYVPGVMALVVMLVTLMLASMAVVREKEMGTLEQIMVTPITQLEFILGKTLPFALIGFADVILITGVAVYWFEVPLRGSLTLLLAATALYLLSTLGVGLFISTVSRTQQQAMMSAFFFYFPAVLLSGFMFPIANMPEVVQWMTYLNPLRYFLVIIRGIFLKGVGPEILWPEMATLALLGMAMLWFAARRLQKTLT
ncbi:MAG: transport permease protein [Nitrospirales bacterium]|nr:MAG: transport permease protein [Nitrospirales bacterium]